MHGIIATWRMALEGIEKADAMLKEGNQAADAIENAVAKALETYRTPDIYTEGTKKVNCKEMGDVVCSLL